MSGKATEIYKKATDLPKHPDWSAVAWEMNKAAHDTEKQLTNTQAALAEAVGALKEIEWEEVETTGGDYACSKYYCLLCGNEQGQGHEEDCKLGQFLQSPAAKTVGVWVKDREEKLKTILKARISDPNNYDSEDLTFPLGLATEEQQGEFDEWLNRLLEYAGEMAAGIVDDIDALTTNEGCQLIAKCDEGESIKRVKLCPVCGSLAYWDSHFQTYVCSLTRCFWKESDTEGAADE